MYCRIAEVRLEIKIYLLFSLGVLCVHRCLRGLEMRLCEGWGGVLVVVVVMVMVVVMYFI